MKIDEIIQAKFKTSQQKAIVNLRYTANFFSNIQNSFMAQFDLTMPQFNILRILRGAETAINIHCVKERMVEKSPNITRIMDKLVLKDMIIRFNCKEDRRAVYVQISDLGLDLLQKIDENMNEPLLFPTNLSDEEAETLSGLLDKMRDGLK